MKVVGRGSIGVGVLAVMVGVVSLALQRSKT